MRSSCGIGDDKFRRIKSADEIFAFRQIHAGFAADRTVNLRNERRGNMNQPHAAKIARGCKACDVADDAASHSHNRRMAIRARANQLARDFFHARKALRGFRVVKKNDCFPRPAPSSDEITLPQYRHTRGDETTNTPVVSPKPLD